MVSREAIEKAYQETYNSYRAATLVGISPTHFKRLMHSYQIPFRPESERRGKPKLNWVPVPSRELAYVLGVLKGDGHVTSVTAKHKNGSKILLQVTDRSFALKFNAAIKSIGLNPHRMRLIPAKSENCKLQYAVSACSKAFALWYHGLSPDQIRQWIAGYEDGFICGLYESDGHMIVCGNDIDISIGKPHKWLILMAKDILTDWGMHPKTGCYKDSRNDRFMPIYRISLHRQEEVLEFFRRVDPVIRRPSTMLIPSQAGRHLEPEVCQLVTFERV